MVASVYDVVCSSQLQLCVLLISVDRFILYRTYIGAEYQACSRKLFLVLSITGYHSFFLAVLAIHGSPFYYGEKGTIPPEVNGK